MLLGRCLGMYHVQERSAFDVFLGCEGTNQIGIQHVCAVSMKNYFLKHPQICRQNGTIKPRATLSKRSKESSQLYVAPSEVEKLTKKTDKAKEETSENNLDRVKFPCSSTAKSMETIPATQKDNSVTWSCAEPFHPGITKTRQ